MQCKDIPTIEILKFLYKRKVEGKIWCTWYSGFENSIDKAFTENYPEKLVIVKMRNLIKKGLVSGCGCGCRGDYEITDKGIEYIFNN